MSQCATVAQCANDNLACDSNTRCGLPDGSECKAAAPKDCASNFCTQSASSTTGAVCCSTACNTCMANANKTNFMPDCKGGICGIGASCGQFQCDANAKCLTKCTCASGASACKNDGTPGSAEACLPGTYCSSATGHCNLG